MKEKTSHQSNTQRVFFAKDGVWYQNNVDLKAIYTAVHASLEYGDSANQLVKEMLVNILELASQGHIDINAPLIITDYGCGQSLATNVLATVLANRHLEISTDLYQKVDFREILEWLEEDIQEAEANIIAPQQIMQYEHITVQRYDIGIPEYSQPLPEKAHVVFCNDVFEHIPEQDLPAFIADLENAGEFVIASISLRDAVNYKTISEEVLLNGAQAVAKRPANGTILSQEPTTGAYIFSLHVSVFTSDKWQEIIGNKWTMLTAQDYTAVSAMNWEPSEGYKDFKRSLIEQIGFADFIPFPTPLGTSYESDPILFHRTAAMQLQKHLFKLNALESYPESSFKKAETTISMDFLKFIGAEPVKDETGWHITEEPASWILKLYALENLSKKAGDTDKAVADAAAILIANYNMGNHETINKYIRTGC